MDNQYTHVHDSYRPDFSLSPPDFLQLNSAHSDEPSIVSQLGMNSDEDFAQNGFNHPMPPYQDSSTSPPSLSTSTEGPGGSSPPFFPPDAPDVGHSASNQSRKLRKDKQRIELAPDQPPTTQGRPRARVFVACVQCRGRKIRCDGAKPKCFHCSQRGGNEECSYDSLPKRRGPDRVQGARTRGTAENDDGNPPPRRRRRRLSTVDQAASGSHGARQPRAAAKPSMLDNLEGMVFFVHPQPRQYGVRIHSLDSEFELSESSSRFDANTSRNQMLTVECIRTGHTPSVETVDENNDNDEATYHTPGSSAMPAANNAVAHRLGPNDITPDPSVQFGRETWFDHVRDLYAISMRVSYDSSSRGLAQRDGTITQITEDIRFIFKHGPHWFSFLNVPRFYNKIMDPFRRSRMQPSLLLCLLAISTFLQSAERPSAEESRRFAMLLRDEAQGYLEASLLARAVDVELAQAAWLLTFFEVCAHPRHQMTRIYSSLNNLDSILRSLAITHLDSDNPTASTFARNAVPVVEASSEQSFSVPQCHPSSMSISAPTQQYAQLQQFTANPTVRGSSCLCDELSLGRQWPEAQSQVPLWVATAMWNPEWTEGEIQKEECRRLCWSALMLVSGQTSFAEALDWGRLDLFMVEPSNYYILFPGESILSSQSQTHLGIMNGKDTVWALYLRAMLLWNACVRMRHDTSISDLDRSDFAMRAWFETEAIERALQRHTCSIERAFMYHGREILFNTRMCISHEFRRFVPHVLIGLSRNKAEEWLRGQGKRARAVIFAMHTVTGNITHSLLYRPWYMWWFMGQVYRALTLWQHDNSLTIALDVCEAFFEPIEFLITFFPGSVQRRRLDELRGRVHAAETASGYVPTPIELA